MQKVGLTGGIGSGKSTVAKMFANLGIPVYYTDDAAKKLMHTSKIIRRKLIQKFGDEVYLNNELNRKFLANLIFTNKDNLKAVNQIVHPKVHQHFNRWLKRLVKHYKGNYIIQENAILFENGSYKNFEVLITVIAPKNVKIKRVLQRDNTTRQAIIDRMNNQWLDKEKVKLSTYVIHNNDLVDTQNQVSKIHKLLSK